MKDDFEDKKLKTDFHIIVLGLISEITSVVGVLVFIGLFDFWFTIAIFKVSVIWYSSIVFLQIYCKYNFVVQYSIELYYI